MPRPRNYYQISKVGQQRKQEQMVAEVEGLREAEKLVEKHLQGDPAHSSVPELAAIFDTR